MSFRSMTAALLLLLAAVPSDAQWQTIDPGGDTMCSDGSPSGVSNTPSFYTTIVNGVRLVDRVGRLLSARPPASVP